MRSTLRSSELALFSFWISQLELIASGPVSASSAFLLFRQQIAAHLAFQAVIHNEPYQMANR